MNQANELLPILNNIKANSNIYYLKKLAILFLILSAIPLSNVYELWTERLIDLVQQKNRGGQALEENFMPYIDYLRAYIENHNVTHRFQDSFEWERFLVIEGVIIGLSLNDQSSMCLDNVIEH